MNNGRDKLITLIVIVLFGLLMVWVVPQINAWAAAEGSNVIECEAGARVIQLAEGRIRVIGDCNGVPPRAGDPVRPDYVEIELVGDPAYEYAYPVPEPPYPYIDNPCDKNWTYGQECKP
jgi:hypothetical protein